MWERSGAWFTYRAYLRDRLRQRVELLSWRDTYLHGITTWAEEALVALVTAVHLCDRDPTKRRPFPMPK
jgi:hypothetical protein